MRVCDEWNKGKSGTRRGLAHRKMANLPLSSFLLQLSPKHPLMRLLTNPFFSRIALIEYRSLSTTHSKYLSTRFPSLFSPANLVTLHLIALATLLHHFRAQRNLLLASLGIIEPISRLFTALHSPPDPQELKHLLSFSLLLSLFSLAESITIHPTTSNKKQQQQRVSFFHSIIPTLLSLLSRTPPSITTPTRPAFPQPRPLKLPPISPLSHSPTPLFPVSLPAYYFSTDLRYRLFKLIVLWIGARKDGTGASAIWEWIIEPFYILFSQREDKKYGKGKRRVVRMVVDEVDTLSPAEEVETIIGTSNGIRRERRKSLFGESPPAGFRGAFGQTGAAMSSEGGADDDRTTTIQSESPTIATSTARSAHHDQHETDHYDTYDESFDSSISISTSNQQPDHSTDGEQDTTISPRFNTRDDKFPTPNHVPYRIASSSFPLHARSSNPALSTSAQQQQQNGFDSPTPTPLIAQSRSIGGYTIEPIHLPSSHPSHTHANPSHPARYAHSQPTSSPSKSTHSGRKSSVDIKRYLDSVSNEMGNAVANGEDVGVGSWAKGSGGFGGAAW